VYCFYHVCIDFLWAASGIGFHNYILVWLSPPCLADRGFECLALEHLVMGNHTFRTTSSDPQEADPPCPILKGAILGLTTLAPFGVPRKRGWGGVHYPPHHLFKVHEHGHIGRERERRRTIVYIVYTYVYEYGLLYLYVLCVYRQ
jgi:hypothetical protein